MVGSYPRPHWFRDQLNGRDVRVAFKPVDHAEPMGMRRRRRSTTRREAGLHVVTDGQMSYDEQCGTTIVQSATTTVR